MILIRILSSDLHWRSHYQFIIPKAYKMLCLLRRVFSSVKCVSLKHSLHLSFVRSKLLYCSPLWCPHLLTHIKSLETVQRRATKFIMGDASMNYHDRLLRLNLLPLMMEFEIADILFLIKSIKYPSTHFNITHFINFSSSNTCSSSAFNTQEPCPMSKVTFTSTTSQGYGILYPPLIQTCPLQLLIQNYNNFSGIISSAILIHIIHALFTIYVHLLTAPSFLSLYIFNVNSFFCFVLFCFVLFFFFCFLFRLLALCLQTLTTGSFSA